ncbi:hypothetical protein LXL04_018188 [Taraxacum kok-saghyz]
MARLHNASGLCLNRHTHLSKRASSSFLAEKQTILVAVLELFFRSRPVLEFSTWVLDDAVQFSARSTEFLAAASSVRLGVFRVLDGKAENPIRVRVNIFGFRFPSPTTCLVFRSSRLSLHLSPSLDNGVVAPPILVHIYSLHKHTYIVSWSSNEAEY